jgi:hypothetical protein
LPRWQCRNFYLRRPFRCCLHQRLQPPPPGSWKHSNAVAVHSDCGIALREHPPRRSVRPSGPSSRGTAHRPLPAARPQNASLLATSTNAAATEEVGILGLPHMVDLPGRRGLAHLAGEIRRPEVLDLDARPLAMRNARLSPLAPTPVRSLVLLMLCRTAHGSLSPGWGRDHERNRGVQRSIKLSSSSSSSSKSASWRTVRWREYRMVRIFP